MNLDGVVDLVVVGGGFPNGGMRNKIDGTSVAIAEPPAILLGLGEGRFVDVWSQLGLDVRAVARGMALGDLDADGDDDILIVDRDGGVIALRNDTAGPSLTVAIEPDCPAAGVVAMITSASGVSFQRLVAPHAYAGAHGQAVIVGTNDDELFVRVRWADGNLTSNAVEPDGARAAVTLGCSD